ncbi:predicted protein [Sclerotinia sclerotiorum 1980 UF-70]|uniref:Uncharacterized protein n=1 Tax=Sclerotinia sclerotiorum (strain ATCC 18683 / 1980 / Ss-1) TaxID=665079 RepID=A7EH66_SCLS1|nr:predicted protein [Sclerotinia sclerotiorum 1980 UF-70]EDO02182.1 predicted protein [Sclerotinia sclerotiorum 1980 UF-70]
MIPCKSTTKEERKKGRKNSERCDFKPGHPSRTTCGFGFVWIFHLTYAMTGLDWARKFRIYERTNGMDWLLRRKIDLLDNGLMEIKKPIVGK